MIFIKIRVYNPLNVVKVVFKPKMKIKQQKRTG